MTAKQQNQFLLVQNKWWELFRQGKRYWMIVPTNLGDLLYNQLIGGFYDHNMVLIEAEAVIDDREWMTPPTKL